MRSCLYEGWVSHRRHLPTTNRFRYRLFMVYLDLDELPSLFEKRWLWSASRPNLAWFRRADHLGDSSTGLSESVRDLVTERTGSRPSGPVRLLTHLRYFGYGFNPVSFYYCFDATDTKVETIVAEVNNTPWGEQHCYVLPAQSDALEREAHHHQLRKAFHVSPFMDMNQDYTWRLGEPGERLSVHMVNYASQQRLFDATLHLERREMSGPALARALARFPLMTVQVVALIYYQALRLWLKRTPLYTHPTKRAPDGAAQT